MPRIIRLPKSVADLIAAGEVVERPASVVKELLENCIDAGAKKITVEIRSGGIRYIRVTDDGCGIAREDIRNAFVSHATSKVRIEEDLNRIGTLGFRGEALASAAAVSRMEVMTRTPDEAIGTRYCIEGGEEVLLDDAGCPVGTTMIVRDLFYNTPARMKFLKKDVTEANAVAGVVDRIALSHPEISVRFIREDKQTLLTPGDGKLDSAVYAVFGREFLQGLLPASFAAEGITVEGLISKPIASRPNRSMQFFFLNGRFIKTGTGSAALSEAYRHAIMAGKYPACVLNIQVPNQLVDVNVHPAKIEVRFANEKAVFNAIYYAAKNALEGDRSKAHPNLKPNPQAVRNYYELTGSEKPHQMDLRDLPQKKPDFFVQTKDAGTLFDPAPKPERKKPAALDVRSPEMAPDPGDSFAFLAQPTADSLPEQTAPQQSEPDIATDTNEQNTVAESNDTETNESAVPAETVPEFRIIGEAFRTYIFVEIENKIWIIDKHAAHERMLYEQLRSGPDGKATQLLLSPIPVTLRKEEYDAVLQNSQLLEDGGFLVEDFGTGTIAVTACPVLLDAEDAKQAIEELAGYLCRSSRSVLSEKMDWIYHNTACRAAIKGGDLTTEYELQKFTEKLLSMPDIRTCPHGRPVMIEMTRRELEKSFGRV
ncbi:MAG: DNA mismatch repair endonuclease MutL [Clostridia bacterium]|nr:DNA mismatch repair endonuclease MutL [Clostridia bacterium]